MAIDQFNISRIDGISKKCFKSEKKRQSPPGTGSGRPGRSDPSGPSGFSLTAAGGRNGS